MTVPQNASVGARFSFSVPPTIANQKQDGKDASAIRQPAASKPAPASNTEMALSFLDTWETRHDLAAIDPDLPKGAPGKIECATFLFPNEREKARRWIDARQGKKNLYVQVNRARKDAPRDERLSGEQIGSFRAIPIDIDIKVEDPSGRLKTKLLEEVAPKIAEWKCPPTVVIDSGGGLQAWWVFDQSIQVTPEDVERVDGIGRTLSERIETDFPEYKLDNVSDLPRLMRLPGTINIPNEQKRKRGRSAALATLLSESGSIYSLGDLAAWAPPTAKRQSKSSEDEKNWVRPDMSLVKAEGDYEELPEELRKKFESACELDPALRDVWNGDEFRGRKDDSGSGAAWALSGRLKRDGRFTVTEFGQLLWVWEHGYALEKIDARTIARDWNRHPETGPTAADFTPTQIDESKRPPAGAKSKGDEDKTDEDKTDEDKISEQESEKRSKLFYRTLAQSEAKISEARPKHLIEGVIPAGAMVVTYGESGQGKSFHAMDRDMHIAGGKPWQGRKATKGGVVWVAAEMSEDLDDRIAAVKQHLGLDNDAPFFAVPCPVDLLRPGGDTKPLIALVQEIEAKHNVKIVKLTVDTLSRALAGGNENAPDDMGALVKHLDRIRYECRCTVEAIHHCGKDTAKGARGHSLLRAATDTEIEIGAGRIKVTKQRSMAGGDVWSFRLKKRRVGMRHDGSSAESCYVETVKGDKGDKRWSMTLSGEQQRWLDDLRAKAPKRPFEVETAMAIWGLDKRTTASDRLRILHGTGHLTQPKKGLYQFADGDEKNTTIENAEENACDDGRQGGEIQGSFRQQKPASGRLTAVNGSEKHKEINA